MGIQTVITKEAPNQRRRNETDCCRDEEAVGGISREESGCYQTIVRSEDASMERINLGRFEPYLLSILRMVVGFTFACHGFQKLFGAFGGLGGRGGTAHLASLFGVAGVLETVGGVLIIAGLFTRCVAFVLSGEMAFAYFKQHAPRGPKRKCPPSS
jgi:uncharacterized membrane protein YphA (DoxX/SURF4 family)